MIPPLHAAVVTAILMLALINVVLGSLVLFDSPRRRINRLFALLAFGLTLWGVSFIILHASESAWSALVWGHVYTASILFVPVVAFHLIVGGSGAFQKTAARGGPIVLERLRRVAYVFATTWMILTISGVFPPVIIPVGDLLLPRTGPHAWLVFATLITLTSTAAFFLSHQAWKSSDTARRSRLLFMLAGSGTALFVLGTSALIGRHGAHSGGPLMALGGAGSTLSLLLIAYALTTSHLYQFAEMCRKGIAYLLMTLILLAVFGSTHWLSRRILIPDVPLSEFFALGVASLIMAMIFHPLRFRMQNLVDRLFFSRRYNQMQRLRTLARRILSATDREELTRILFPSLREVGFASGCLLLKNPQKPLFVVQKTMGQADSATGLFLPENALLIQYLRDEKRELVRDEVTRRIMADWERQALGDEMALLGAEICFPLISTHRRALFGVLALGHSELGYASYQGRNIFWLKAVIENAAIMLDNFYHHEFANALIPYVGRTWADEMRRNKDGFRERLCGHRTWVAILMVDIRQFTNLSGRMDPNEVVGLIKEFRSIVAPVVYRFQGTIDKFIGDAIMVVFGLPILPPLENPDHNAVSCARDIATEIGRLNHRRQFEEGKEPISVGIGISSGDVIAGNVDSGDRVEYTVIGDAANMVARLEDLAGVEQILLSPATYGRVRDIVSATPWEPRMITGFGDPVVIYELHEVYKPAEMGPPPETELLLDETMSIEESSPI